MKFRLDFNLDIFIEAWRPTMAKYFRGEITAVEAAKYLGIPPGSWKGVISNIFHDAITGSSFGTITEIE